MFKKYKNAILSSLVLLGLLIYLIVSFDVFNNPESMIFILMYLVLSVILIFIIIKAPNNKTYEEKYSKDSTRDDKQNIFHMYILILFYVLLFMTNILDGGSFNPNNFDILLISSVMIIMLLLHDKFSNKYQFIIEVALLLANVLAILYIIYLKHQRTQLDSIYVYLSITCIMTFLETLPYAIYLYKNK